MDTGFVPYTSSAEKCSSKEFCQHKIMQFKSLSFFTTNLSWMNPSGWATVDEKIMLWENKMGMCEGVRVCILDSTIWNYHFYTLKNSQVWLILTLFKLINICIWIHAKHSTLPLQWLFCDKEYFACIQNMIFDTCILLYNLNFLALANFLVLLPYSPIALW